MAKQLTPEQQAAKDAAKQRVADVKAARAEEINKPLGADDAAQGTTGTNDAGAQAGGPDASSGQNADGDATGAGSDAQASGDTSGNAAHGAAPIAPSAPNAEVPHDCAGLIAALQGKLDEANATISTMQSRMNEFEASLKRVTDALYGLTGFSADKRGTLHGHIDDLPKVS